MIFCVSLNAAVVGVGLSAGVAGWTAQAAAGVYPKPPVQNSVVPWEHARVPFRWKDAERALKPLSEPKPLRRPEKPAAAERTAKRAKENKPRLAIVIDDLGLNRRRTNRIIDLPGPLTLAFLPYGNGMDRMSRDARRRGHEIFLHLPMQPFGNENPGPNALLDSLTLREFDRRMNWAFDQVEGIKGFNNHMGSRLTSNPLAMEHVMAEARRRGLLFLDSRTSQSSVALSQALAGGVKATARDIFLDHDPSAESIVSQLGKLEHIAKSRGYAIAIGHPYDTTYGVLKRYLPRAVKRGFELVTVSDVIVNIPSTVRVSAAPSVPRPSAGGAPQSGGKDSRGAANRKPTPY